VQVNEKKNHDLLNGSNGNEANPGNEDAEQNASENPDSSEDEAEFQSLQ
jgi:hypothetical protein